ncbi:hypothetical protein [Botrimarina hoheduenensis]|uniref:Uncharacterized protein n=1 Tax=Botrimarina hoheduenensis TaxID=2528000 RepID=A0A5C5WFQ8_9BACT|nr:hypothetical protein [Botrimarina hoheduenensis]TWT48925.1 hypothetical protein Pla111_07030 [Botrimarina hoheduenensis]
MNPIEAGKEALEAIVLPLQEEKRALTERIAEIDITLKPLEAAISPLEGKARGKKKPNPGATARTVTQEDVRKTLLRLLDVKPAASKESLLAAAKKSLKVEQGLDLKGFSNRCREVLSEEPFHVDEAGRVRLIDAAEELPAAREAALHHREPKTAVDNFASGVLGR